MEYLATSAVDAYVADREMRRRDPAFANAGRYKERFIPAVSITENGTIA